MRTHLQSDGWPRRAVVRAWGRDAQRFALGPTAESACRSCRVLRCAGICTRRERHRGSDAHAFALGGSGHGPAMRTHLHSTGRPRASDAHAFALGPTAASDPSFVPGVVIRTHLHSPGRPRRAAVRAGGRDAHAFALAKGGAGAAMRTDLHSTGRPRRDVVRAGHRDAHAFALGRFRPASEGGAHGLTLPTDARELHGEIIAKMKRRRKGKGCFYAADVMSCGRGGARPPSTGIRTARRESVRDLLGRRSDPGLRARIPTDRARIGPRSSTERCQSWKGWAAAARLSPSSSASNSSPRRRQAVIASFQRR